MKKRRIGEFWELEAVRGKLLTALPADSGSDSPVGSGL